MNYYINRELSWLKFNGRVLEQAGRPEVPLLEQLRFAAIFTSNLDEFFMVRVGGLRDRALLPDSPPDNKTGMTPSEQLTAIYAAARPYYRRRDRLFEELDARLAERGIERFPPRGDNGLRKAARRYFRRELLPVLSPQIVDAKHPFPHLENKRSYAALLLRRGDRQFAGIVAMPAVCPTFAELETEDGRFVYALPSELVLRFADELFEGCEILARAVVRITRNADVEIADNFSDDEADTLRYPDYVRILVKRREKLAPVRLELYYGGYAPSEKLRRFFFDKLPLSDPQCFVTQSPPDMSFIWPLTARLASPERADLFFAPAPPRPDPTLAPAAGRIIDIADKRDILVSCPYYSMRPYLRLLSEAAEDPEVVSIKITLYRLSPESEVAFTLCRAAENGKEVTAMVELKARFDETNNIGWASRLEEAGCKVIYGLEGLKVHSKVTLISRMSGGKLLRTAHIGTGNYNEKTARQYTDVGIITSDPELCGDAAALFGWLSLGDPSSAPGCTALLAAPHTLKDGILSEIRREAKNGADGYIFMKLNGLTDKEIIDALAEASRAGAKVELVVRGVCCLLPGVPGETENISVTSIVGRFLEHSRIFIFGADEDSRRTYIGSADMMTRNTTRRVELIAPVRDRAIAARLCAMTRLLLRDNVKSSRLCSNGEYERVITPFPPIDSQMKEYEGCGGTGSTGGTRLS